MSFLIFNNTHFKLNDVIGDGNCFFSAICLHPFFKAKLDNHVTLRRSLASKLEKCISEDQSDLLLKSAVLKIYSTFEQNKPILDHISSMRQDRQWVGQFEAFLLMIFYNIEITIISAMKNTETQQWKFGVGTTWETLINILKLPPEFISRYHNNKMFCQHIYLLHHKYGSPLSTFFGLLFLPLPKYKWINKCNTKYWYYWLYWCTIDRFLKLE